MLGRVKLDKTLLICDHGHFNQITARSHNRTLFTVVRDTSTTTVPPAPRRRSFLFMSSVKDFYTSKVNANILVDLSGIRIYNAIFSNLLGAGYVSAFSLEPYELLQLLTRKRCSQP